MKTWDNNYEELLAEAERLGACADGLKWAREAGPDWSGISQANALWAARYLTNRLTDEQVAAIVASFPWAAARYLTNRLTDAHVAAIVASKPWAATLVLSDRLTDEQVAAIVDSAPRTAFYLADRL